MLNTIFEPQKFIFTIPLIAAATPTNDTSFLSSENSISIGSTSFVPSTVQIPLEEKFHGQIMIQHYIQ